MRVVAQTHLVRRGNTFNFRSRVEQRLRPQGLKLTALPKIANPFADIILPTASIPAPPDEPDTKIYLWAKFQDSIKVAGDRGVEPAA